MELIPVIDLMQGLVVHAKGGQRDQYQPIKSPLSLDPSPERVIEGLLTLAPFKTVYIADLDALMGHQPQWRRLNQLTDAFPEILFWLDVAGLDVPRRGVKGPLRVVGSESLALCFEERLSPWPQESILSLDFMGAHFKGPPGLLVSDRCWPCRVILMNLARVGRGDGPHLAQLECFRADFPGHDYFVAGGVRHEADLLDLKVAGAKGVLLASALHDARIGPLSLSRIMTG